MKHCSKVCFKLAEDAKKRSSEIYKENGKSIEAMRVYFCPVCDKYHLTSMKKQRHRYITNLHYRQGINERSFIKKWSEHFEFIFKI